MVKQGTEEFNELKSTLLENGRLIKSQAILWDYDSSKNQNFRPLESHQDIESFFGYDQGGTNALNCESIALLESHRSGIDCFLIAFEDAIEENKAIIWVDYPEEKS